MRSLLLLAVCAGVAVAQPFSAGIKAGLPLTDFVNTVQEGASTSNGYYVVGPMVEVRLPFGLGVEFDALYRHFSYTDIPVSVNNAAMSLTTSSGDWEFPLVAKYKFHGKLVRPYVEAGVAWDALSGLSSSVEGAVSSTPYKSTTMGFVMGGGVDLHLFMLHIAPELRYTRWTSQHFNVADVLNSNQNQAEFLVGITF